MLTPVCPTCQAAVEPEWRHCGACGTPLSEALAAEAAAAAPVRARILVIDHPGLFLGIVIVVLLLGAGAAIVNERRLDDRRQQLEQTRRTLKDTESVLGAVRAELGERVAERDKLRAELDAAKGSLTDAQRSVKSQGEQLETLKGCLSAIEEISVALDRGDRDGARAAADRADRFCTEAIALL